MATVACGGVVARAWIRGPRFGRGSWVGGARCENDYRLTGHAADVVELVVLYAGPIAALEAGEAIASVGTTSGNDLTKLDQIASRLADALGVDVCAIEAWTSDAVSTVLADNERALQCFAEMLASRREIPWPRGMKLLRGVRRFDAVADFERVLRPLPRGAAGAPQVHVGSAP